MGEQAASGIVSNYKNTFTGIKRLIGLPFDDPRAQKEMKMMPGTKFVPFEHPGSDSAPTVGVQVEFNGESKTVSMEAIAGMMIKHVGIIAAEKAAQQSNAPIESLMPQDWVISCPYYYTDSQRRALLTACEVVGITGVQRLMHDTTATALAYGIFKDLRQEFGEDKPTNVMFIDFGASSYTVSIVSFVKGKLIVKSVHGDPDLGGRDFDWAIAKWIGEGFSKKYAGKLSGDPLEKPKTLLKILAAAEKAKKTLSPHGVKEARLSLEMLMDDFDYFANLKAEEYEAMCAPLLDRLAGPIQAALEETKLSASDLAAVEIVGGSTRINCVKQKLLSILGISTLSTTLNADESVSRGCALQSAILSPRFKVLPYDIQESQPFPITIKWDESEAEGMEVDEDGNENATDQVVMFPRGLSFPVVRRVTLKRNSEFAVEAIYEDSSTKYGFSAGAGKDIAKFTIKVPAGDVRKIRVNVKQDIHGIIQFSSAQMIEEVEEESVEQSGEAETKETEDQKKKKVKKTNLEFSVARPLDWSKTLINKVFEEEVSMANHDRVVKETADMRNELESYIYDMRDKIELDSQLGAYATAEEKENFKAKNEATENWLYEDGFDATKSTYAEKLNELKALGSPIEKRQTEAEARPTAVSVLQAEIERYKKWANESQGDEKYSHISDEERQIVHKACDETSAWVYDLMDKQGSLALNQDPVLTVADLKSKAKLLKEKCGPVVSKPKPKPPPEPKKEEKKDPPAEQEGKQSSGDSNMDVDGDESKPEGENEPMVED